MERRKRMEEKTVKGEREGELEEKRRKEERVEEEGGQDDYAGR